MTVLLTIGRDPGNDIVLPESYISGQHAQIIRDNEGRWFINDLHSANGTFVNGVQVKSPVQLFENDEVVLGGSSLNWKNIYQQYSAPAVPPTAKKKNKLVTYSFAFAGALLIFYLLYLANEYFFTNNGKNTTDSTANNNKGKYKVPEHITYDLSCVTYSDYNTVNRMADKMDSMERAYIDNSGVTVSLQEEIDFGNQNHQGLLRGSTVLDNADSRHLNDILNSLTARISQPRGFNYRFFLIDSKELNSWTSGGRIYFTTVMLKFCKNDDEIAAILGHEINHNELYHINRLLKAHKLAVEKFGDKNGQIAATINAIISKPFGKKDEANCDLHGEDLVIAAGYDPCNVLNLWKRMARLEGEHGPIDKFTTSHPFAAARVTCIQNHLKVNYGITCPGN